MLAQSCVVSGLRILGHRGIIADRQSFTPMADLHVTWGWHNEKLQRACKGEGKPLLVMERGCLPDRMKYCTLGLDGYGNQARHTRQLTHRLDEVWPGLVAPITKVDNKKCLIIGQVPGDASLNGEDIMAWCQFMTDVLLKGGWEVYFRPHPVTQSRSPVGAKSSNDLLLPGPGRESLPAQLRQVALCVTHSSTVGVEAIMAGVPTYIHSNWSHAFPASWRFSKDHSEVYSVASAGDMMRWANSLAARNWSFNEIRDGHGLEEYLECL